LYKASQLFVSKCCTAVTTKVNTVEQDVTNEVLLQRVAEFCYPGNML